MAVKEVVTTDTWDRDDIQFPRLLAEIHAMGLTDDQFATLAAEMDTSIEDLGDVFWRATNQWDEIKAATYGGGLHEEIDACPQCGAELE